MGVRPCWAGAAPPPATAARTAAPAAGRAPCHRRNGRAGRAGREGEAGCDSWRLLGRPPGRWRGAARDVSGGRGRQRLGVFEVGVREWTADAVAKREPAQGRETGEGAGGLPRGARWRSLTRARTSFLTCDPPPIPGSGPPPPTDRGLATPSRRHLPLPLAAVRCSSLRAPPLPLLDTAAGSLPPSGCHRPSGISPQRPSIPLVHASPDCTRCGTTGSTPQAPLLGQL